MDNAKPLIFKHITTNEAVSDVINIDSFVQFVSGIAMAILSDRGLNILTAFRLLLSPTPCVITDEELYLIPYDMYPNNAKAEEKEIEEATSIANNLKKKLIIMPLSLATLDGDGSKRLVGANYLVRIEK